MKTTVRIQRVNSPYMNRNYPGYYPEDVRPRVRTLDDLGLAYDVMQRALEAAKAKAVAAGKITPQQATQITIPHKEPPTYVKVLTPIAKVAGVVATGAALSPLVAAGTGAATSKPSAPAPTTTPTVIQPTSTGTIVPAAQGIVEGAKTIVEHAPQVLQTAQALQTATGGPTTITPIDTGFVGPPAPPPPSPAAKLAVPAGIGIGLFLLSKLL